MVSHTSSGARLNEVPVLPRLVHADALTWTPLLSSTGERVHGFVFSHEGERVSTVEASTDGSCLKKVAIVHASYSRLNMETNTCDVSSLLVYEDPEKHLHQLEELINAPSKDRIYAPVSECFVCRGLPELALRIQSTRDPMARSAPFVWKEVTHFLRRMGDLTARGINKHNEAELNRVVASELVGVVTRDWCG